MEIEKASAMGFCFGVRRAIELAQKAVSERGSLQTIGPLVHNRQVVDRLAMCGVGVAASLDDVQCDTVVIASHGASPHVIDQVRASGLNVIDATCPFVRKAQIVAQKLGKAGFWVLVFGDVEHPEVRGVLGWAGDNASASLEVPSLNVLPQRLGILCQTTQSQELFTEFARSIVHNRLAKFAEIRIFNTICDATRKHQAAAVDLARRVDLLFVIGSQESANTQRLVNICAKTGVATYHIETAAGIDRERLSGHHQIGITAGTSTPDDVIDEVVSLLQAIG